MTDFIDRTLADPAVTTVGLAIATAWIALWLATAWWAYADAARRSHSIAAPLLAAAWIILSTPLFLPISVLIYTLVRPQATASEGRARALVWELSHSAAMQRRCRACGSHVDPAWRRCPACTAWLQAPCASCGAWSDRDLPACPWCATEGHADPVAPRAGGSARRSVARRGAIRLARGHAAAHALRASDRRAGLGSGAAPATPSAPLRVNP